VDHSLRWEKTKLHVVGISEPGSADDVEIVARFGDDLRAWNAEYESLQSTEIYGGVSRYGEGLNAGEARSVVSAAYAFRPPRAGRQLPGRDIGLPSPRHAIVGNGPIRTKAKIRRMLLGTPFMRKPMAACC